MQSPPLSTEWRGGGDLPHATSNIRKIEQTLRDGAPSIWRNQLGTVLAKQRQEGRKRCAKDGMVLSFMLVNDESNNLDKQIVSGEFVYISRNGSNGPLYAAGSEYRILAPRTSVTFLPMVEISDEVSRKVVGEFSRFLHGSACGTRNLVCLAPHLCAPVAIAISFLDGLTPGSFVRGIQWALRVLGEHGLADTIQLSKDVVAYVWFWRLLAFFVLCRFGTYIYVRRS